MCLCAFLRAFWGTSLESGILLHHPVDVAEGNVCLWYAGTKEPNLMQSPTKVCTGRCACLCARLCAGLGTPLP